MKWSWRVPYTTLFLKFPKSRGAIVYPLVFHRTILHCDSNISKIGMKTCSICPLKWVHTYEFPLHEQWTAKFKLLHKAFIVGETSSLTMKLIEVIWISRFIVHDVGIHTCGPYFRPFHTILDPFPGEFWQIHLSRVHTYEFPYHEQWTAKFKLLQWVSLLVKTFH